MVPVRQVTMTLSQLLVQIPSDDPIMVGLSTESNLPEEEVKQEKTSLEIAALEVKVLRLEKEKRKMKGKYSSLSQRVESLSQGVASNTAHLREERVQ